MKYKNIKTGSVIDVQGHITGGNWQALTPAGSGTPVTLSGKPSGENKQETVPEQKKKPVKKTKE